MKIIKPSYKILTKINQKEVYDLIETCGRLCYKSENKNSEEFIKKIIKLGHESVLEHYNISVKFCCNRGFTHELVRHRLASYSQESTRYCNYSKSKFNNEITVIKPIYFDEGTPAYDRWIMAMNDSEKAYLKLLNDRCCPQEARGVLPIDIKTEIVITANLREWRHIFNLRCSHLAHPSMRELMLPLKNELHKYLPVIFNSGEDFINNDLNFSNPLDYEYRHKYK
jgi:thymidylate synthase (FAD)